MTSEYNTFEVQWRDSHSGEWEPQKSFKTSDEANDWISEQPTGGAYRVMEPKVISHSDWIENGRDAVLDALDRYVRITTQFGTSRGWTEQELPDLFRAIDAHLGSVARRINLGLEPGSEFVRIEQPDGIVTGEWIRSGV